MLLLLLFLLQVLMIVGTVVVEAVVVRQVMVVVVEMWIGDGITATVAVFRPCRGVITTGRGETRRRSIEEGRLGRPFFLLALAANNRVEPERLLLLLFMMTR